MSDKEDKEDLSESRAMRDEIRKTESEIAASIRAIRERLSPEHLKNKVLHKVICAAMARLERAGCLVRQHPVRTLLAGVMLGWLALRKRQSACRRRSVN